MTETLFSFTTGNKLYTYRESYEELTKDFHAHTPLIKVLEITPTSCGRVYYHKGLTISYGVNGLRKRIEADDCSIGTKFHNVVDGPTRCSIEVVDLSMKTFGEQRFNFRMWARLFMDFCMENKEAIPHVFLAYHEPFSTSGIRRNHVKT